MRINQAIREIASQFPTLPIRRRRAIAPTLARDFAEETSHVALSASTSER